MRLKQAGMMALVAICKGALILAMLEASGAMLESAAEASTEIDVEFFGPTEGQGNSTRPLVRRCWTAAASDSGYRAVKQLARRRGAADSRHGHRLANGLRAPLLC